MIARYSRQEMAQLWSEKSRYLTWLRVESAVCQELAVQGRIPKKDWGVLRGKLDKLIAQGGVEPARVEHHEKITRHDVIAFTTAVAEKIGPLSRYIHFGLTSSDVVDTALSMVLLEVGKVLKADYKILLERLKSLAVRYKDLPTIGRSHGIFAEPTSFGLKFLGWYVEWQRNLKRLEQATDGLRVGKLSGAVGVNPHWGPVFEQKVLRRSDLRREEVSTQVIPRDRHADFLNAIALAGSSIERIAIELRHLQRSEVNEVVEGFKKGQRGSSAMPHKRNPISSENLTGCARLLRSYAQAGMENVALWHERDISHSSVERVALPDATILLDYAIHRLDKVLSELLVLEEKVSENLAKAGKTVFSGHFLLALVQAGATREDAYSWVQACALASLDGQGDFVELLSNHPEVRKKLLPKEIKKLGSIDYQLRSVDEIYKRVLRSTT